MSKISYSEIVSSLALFIASIGLIWNIIKELILDQVSINFYIAFGEAGNIKNSETSLFAEAGSLKPDHKFDNPKTLVKIINTGRRPMVIRNIEGKLIDKSCFSMAVTKLPKLLQPYEEFSIILDLNDNFMEYVKNNKIKKLWVEDTKNKKWFLKSKNLKRLKDTAEYINLGKNL